MSSMCVRAFEAPVGGSRVYQLNKNMITASDTGSMAARRVMARCCLLRRWHLAGPEVTDRRSSVRRVWFWCTGCVMPVAETCGSNQPSPLRQSCTSPAPWREFPCFHADLPGLVRRRFFFPPAWAIKKIW